MHSEIIWRPVPAVSAAVRQLGRVKVHSAAEQPTEVLIEIKPARGKRSLAAEANGRMIAHGRSMSECKSKVENVVRGAPERLLARAIPQ
jgi:hypothetical protein